MNRNFSHTKAEARKARIRVRIKRRLRSAGVPVRWNASIAEMSRLLNDPHRHLFVNRDINGQRGQFCLYCDWPESHTDGERNE